LLKKGIARRVSTPRCSEEASGKDGRKTKGNTYSELQKKNGQGRVFSNREKANVKKKKGFAPQNPITKDQKTLGGSEGWGKSSQHLQTQERKENLCPKGNMELTNGETFSWENTGSKLEKESVNDAAPLAREKGKLGVIKRARRGSVWKKGVVEKKKGGHGGGVLQVDPRKKERGKENTTKTTKKHNTTQQKKQHKNTKKEKKKKKKTTKTQKKNHHPQTKTPKQRVVF